jgi:hypothetical protein
LQESGLHTMGAQHRGAFVHEFLNISTDCTALATSPSSQQ